MRILLVDDDPTIVILARKLLEETGCVVVVADTLESARQRAMTDEYDGIVLDLDLPDGNGVTLVQEMRDAGRKNAILILTGTKRNETLVKALDAGADDYINKPIAFDEFKARVRALVRRGGAKHTQQLSAGNIVIERITRDVLVNGKKLDLTPRELSLLEQLVIKSGQVVTRKELLSKVMDMSFDPGTNVLDVNVSRLRKKLKDTGATVKVVVQMIRATEAELGKAGGSELSAIRESLSRGASALAESAEWIVKNYKADIKAVHAGAFPFLKLAGIVCGGWQMARAALVARRKLDGIAKGGTGDAAFYQGKIGTALFYADHVLSQAVGLREAVLHGARGVMALAEEQF